MSEAVSTNLPRFDVPSAMPGLSALQSLRFDTSDVEAVLQGADSDAPTGSDASGRADQEQHIEPDVETDASAAALETTLLALSETIDRIEHEAGEQVVTTVQSIAAKLFPQLSELFMVEEIGRHLPQLIPVSSASVVIHTPPSLMGKLRHVIDGTSTLSSRCTLVPTESSVKGRVDISWQTGGLNFDFNGLLDACLARLGPAQTKYGSTE